MTIWKQLYGAISGGWKTYGPNGADGPGPFDSNTDPDASPVTETTVMRLSAMSACLNLRSETVGTLPLHLRDAEKNILRDHPLYYILHDSPNAYMTAPEYWSLCVAHIDLKGNAISIIDRGYNNKVVALNPVDPDNAVVTFNKSGRRKTWKIGKDDYDDSEILHLKGFSLDGVWGASRLELGRQILGAQIDANTSAMRAFRQGLKVGGFLLNEGTRDFTSEQMQEIQKELVKFGRPENSGRMMTLLRGLKPVAGTEFSVKPADAQLLESRHFGIEEICRLCNVPPPLIGHTGKASSWASSLENLNLHFQLYSVQPTVIRAESSISKKLLTVDEVRAGIRPKFSMQGLMRGDTKTRMAQYASGLQNGWLNRDEVRDFEELGKIPGGDKYTVQLNMTDVNDLSATDGTDDKAKKDDQP